MEGWGDGRNDAYSGEEGQGERGERRFTGLLAGWLASLADFLFSASPALLLQLIWAMGVLTVAYAAWRSVDDLRRKMSRPVTVFGGGVPGSKPEPKGAGMVDDEEDAPALELTLTHAFGFIVVASSVLLILFYIDL